MKMEDLYNYNLLLINQADVLNFLYENPTTAHRVIGSAQSYVACR